MKIKNIKKKLLTKLLLTTLAISGCMIHQSLPVHAEDASNHTKKVNESNYDGGDIYASITDSGNANNNTLTVSNVDASNANQIDAALTYSGNANNNTTTINNVKSNGFIHGGYATGNGNAEYNIVNFNGGTVYHLHGGHASNGNALYNTVNFFDGTVTNVIGGGFTDYGSANYNTLNIYGGTINGTAYGGTYYGSSSNGDAIGNTLNIYGGAISGDVYGGWAPNGNANDNTINVYGSPNLSSATLHAGSANNKMSGNSLNIYTKNITAINIDGFQDLNFHFQNDLQNGDTILRLTDSNGTDLSNTTVNINASGGIDLHTGDTFTLLQNNNGIAVSNVTNSGTISEGISLDYGLTIPELNNTTSSSSGSSSNYMENNYEESLTKITAVVGELQSDGLKTQTKLLNNTVQAGVILAHTGEDRIVKWLPPEDDYKDIDIVDIDPHNEFRIFANSDFSSLKIKTGNGSFIRSRSGGMDLGFAKAVESASGNKLIFAPVFDYGAGNYNSYLPDGTHGHGDSNYYAGGFIFRKMNKKSGFYYEASARLGRARSNFFSNEFKAGNNRIDVSYSVSAPIYAGHIHIGQIYPINRENTFQVYGQYFHTHQGGMDTTLSSGEDYNFDSIDSGRMRAGVRLIRELPNKKNRFYSGLAYQYEFNGDAVGHYKDYSTSKSTMKGSSGMLELGWQVKPSKKSPWMLDLGTVGWIGYQKGITCQVKFKRAF